jgi:hypothetical protein
MVRHMSGKASGLNRKLTGYFFFALEGDEVVALEVLNLARTSPLKVDDESGGDAGAVGVPAGGGEADVVDLRAAGRPDPAHVPRFAVCDQLISGDALCAYHA